jgi:hypothetical protein
VHACVPSKTTDYRDKNEQFEADVRKAGRSFSAHLGIKKEKKLTGALKHYLLSDAEIIHDRKRSLPSWPQTSRLPALAERKKPLDFHNLLSAAP